MLSTFQPGISAPVPELSLPFLVTLFISSDPGPVRNPIVWRNISFRASEANSGTQTGNHPKVGPTARKPAEPASEQSK